jgi:hypothetical protein
VSGERAIKRFDASSYFVRDPVGAQVANATAKFRAANGIENLQSRQAALAASAFIGGSSASRSGPTRTRTAPSIHRRPIRLGWWTTMTLASRSPHRPAEGSTKRAYRTVYFRPLNLGFSESIAPEFAEQNAFGRVDSAVSYTKTARSYSVSFEVHAFAPEDLEPMYSKLHWLRSMCYPSYTPDGLIQSGPVIRLRIGDAVGTSAGGLGGVIRNLGIDYSDVLWSFARG